METIIVFGLGFILGLYLATQIEKKINNRITSSKKTEICRCGKRTKQGKPMCCLCSK